MKIAIVGGGGREHALRWRLAQSPRKPTLVTDPDEADLVVVGPEGPLVDGIVDQLRDRGVPCVGPKAAAARLEGSKVFAKNFMRRHNIPTARFAADPGALHSFGHPVVIKADGLAGGKGVVIAQNAEEAEQAISQLSGPFVIEEFLEGEEVSFIVLADEKTVLPLEPTQDHKRVYDGDRGPNTGGMGAYCDTRILTESQTGEIMDTIVEPVLAGMRKEGSPFTGFLYAGLMMTATGPKVLEFNVRLGDPETQALMHRMESDFATVLEAAALGELSGHRVTWKPGPSICVVLAAHGYPGEVRIGDVIDGLPAAEGLGATVFESGTRIVDGKLVTAGGRVLGVTASGTDLPHAIADVYRAVDCIHFNGMHYRRDIGRKGLQRYNESYSGT